jgi:hypothetical protein
MNLLVQKPYKFADRVIADGKKGTVIGSNDIGITVQFVTGKADILWVDLVRNPDRVKLAN